MATYYCTGANVIAELPLFAGQDDVEETDIDAWAVTPYNYINAKLAKYYAVPFSTGASTPPIIHEIALLLLKAKTIREIYYSENPKDVQSERAEQLRDEAIAMLKSICAEDKDDPMEIIDIAGNLILRRTTMGKPWSSTTSKDKVFILSEDEWDYDLKVDAPTSTDRTTTEANKYL